MISSQHEGFARLTQIMLPYGGYVLGMIEAYFDESGTHKGAPLLCVAGYLFEREKAVKFDAEWRTMLQELEVDFFHMTSCNAGSFPFHKTSEPIRTAMVNRAIRLIHDHMTYGIVVAVREEKFDSYVPSHPLVGSAYSWLVNQTLGAVRVWADQQQYNGQISYFFESGHPHQPEANGIMNLTAMNEEKIQLTRYAGHAFRPKKETPALQAADLLAWHYCNDWARRAKGEYSKDQYAKLIDDRHWHMRWSDKALAGIAKTIRDAMKKYPDAGQSLTDQLDS